VGRHRRVADEGNVCRAETAVLRRGHVDEGQRPFFILSLKFPCPRPSSPLPPSSVCRRRYVNDDELLQQRSLRSTSSSNCQWKSRHLLLLLETQHGARGRSTTETDYRSIGACVRKQLSEEECETSKGRMAFPRLLSLSVSIGAFSWSLARPDDDSDEG
jgi:hypothetical protein